MKVISLTQPWASLIVMGHKLIETRPWRIVKPEILKEIQDGGLYIHASESKFIGKSPYRIRCRELCTQPHFYECVGGLRGYDELPFGAIIGKVEMKYILPTEDLVSFGGAVYPDTNDGWTLDEKERAFGDYSPGRYGWLLSNPVKFEKPIQAKGSLSVWDFDI